ncbi:MAG TPA: ribonuclease P protein component, partial [Nitriliruptorales bacterium]|nr:ribonuclease P protein component [Nitriliruptorales bacterium]
GPPPAERLSTVTTVAAVLPDRLRSSRAIEQVLRRGRQKAGRRSVIALTPTDGSATRLAVVASRRVGTAVRRNRAKRLLREAARGLPWRPGLDVVLVARAECADSELAAVRSELCRLAVELRALDPQEAT